MHFAWVEVNEEALRLRAIDAAGGEIDSVEIARGKAEPQAPRLRILVAVQTVKSRADCLEPPWSSPGQFCDCGDAL
jgi:hypothetical protein